MKCRCRPSRNVIGKSVVAQHSGGGVRHYSNACYRFSRYRSFLRLAKAYNFRFSIYSLVYSSFDSVRPKFRRWRFGIIQTRSYRFSRYLRILRFQRLAEAYNFFVSPYIHLYILSLIRCAQNSGDGRSALFKHVGIGFKIPEKGLFRFLRLAEAYYFRFSILTCIFFL